MVGTHYDVLGVAADATGDQIRRAYVDRARLLHPDANPGAPDAARRAMQDLNEAWRVLRDPAARAAYDRSLQPAAAPQPVSDLDRPYERAPAEPGDLTVAVVRAIPWLAALVVLAIIFVFTAFAKNDRDEAPAECPPGAEVIDPVTGRSACP